MLKSLAIVGLLLTSVAAHAEQRAALVVGNDNYDHLPDLTKAVNDAKAMGATFKDLGYQVTIGTDLNHKSWLDLVQKFTSSLEKDSTAVVYIAGHGLNVGGTQYIVLTDAPEIAPKASAETFLASAINFDVFLQALGKTQASTLLIIFDSCRNNPFDRAAESLSQITDIKQNMAMMFSASPGSCPFETVGSADTSTTSPFVRILIEELQ